MSDGDGRRTLQVTIGLRSLAAGLAIGSLLCSWLSRRFSPSSATKRRILKLLDAVAPRVSLSRAGMILNTDCPICLNALEEANSIRKLECRHALCASCLEQWIIQSVRSHLNPARFSISPRGVLYSYVPGPSCPLCKAPLPCVPEIDLRSTLVAALSSSNE